MKTIVIKTQAEMDALPNGFDEYTIIEIGATERVVVRKARENSRVEAWGNSRVEAWGNSRVEARENSRVEARENSRVEARENSRVVARENSRVVARENSSVVARENSSVVARENSSVVALENSSVEAWGNSSVEALGNSSVVARENSSVEAWGNSSVEALGNSSVVARENSSVEAWENSKVEAWGNSRVVAWGNSRVDGFLCATIVVCSVVATVKSLLDNAHLIYKKAGCRRPEKQDASAKITEFEELVTPTFEQWFERGYVHADGITEKMLSRKVVGDIEVFHTQSLGIGQDKRFVVKRGNTFSHGNTVKEAMEDLQYKISDRDTTEYKKWALDTTATKAEMIVAYRKITGACAKGVRGFIESKGKEVKDTMTVQEVIAITTDAYGGREFKEFFA